MTRIALFASMLLSFAAFADSSRVAVLDFKGPKAQKARNQVMKSLCRSENCVSPGQHGEEIDVDAVVTGQVKKVAGKQVLHLAVYLSEDDAPVSANVALCKSGKIKPQHLAKALTKIKKTLRES